jgi:hypothetical protein
MATRVNRYRIVQHRTQVYRVELSQPKLLFFWGGWIGLHVTSTEQEAMEYLDELVAHSKEIPPIPWYDREFKKKVVYQNSHDTHLAWLRWKNNN